MKLPINSHIMNIVIQVLGKCSHKKGSEVSPVEHMRDLLKKKNLLEDDDAKFSMELLIRVCRHEPFLKDVIKHILKKEGDSFSLVALYCLLFLVDEESKESIQTAFKESFSKPARRLLRFIHDESCLATITKVACAHYDLEYVEELVRAYDAKIHLIKELYDLFEPPAKKPVVKWKPTVPEDVAVLRPRIKAPPAPAPTPMEEMLKLRSNVPPKSTYHEDLNLKMRLNEEKQRNHEATMKLKQEADDNAFRCAKAGPSKKIELVNEEFINKKPSIRKLKLSDEPVEIRTNVASVLRQEAHIVKKEREENRFYDDLIAGACDSSQIYAWQDQIRQDDYENKLLVVRKKHLQGLLTHEEAALAKHKLIVANKEKMIEFKREKEMLEKMLQEWKVEQESEIKMKVERGHEIDRAAKNAFKSEIEKKHVQARIQMQETKAMIQQALRTRQKELENKIRMIKEIRALQSMRELRVKEYDHTTTSGLGLLCEMSIAELKERLYILQVEMKEELEMRQKTIREKKDNQKQHLENAKATISKYKTVQEVCRKANKVTPTAEVEDDADLLNLKRQLQQKREERMKIYMKP